MRTYAQSYTLNGRQCTQKVYIQYNEPTERNILQTWAGFVNDESTNAFVLFRFVGGGKHNSCFALVSIRDPAFGTIQHVAVISFHSCC